MTSIARQGFIADAAKGKLDPHVLSGEGLQGAIAEISNLPSDLLNKAMEITRATVAKGGGD